MRLGVVEGMTFRTVIEDGVGVFIVPNPKPNRTNPQAVPTPRRRLLRRSSGDWSAKPLHVTWK